MAHEPGTVFSPLVKLPKDLNACWPWLGNTTAAGIPIKQWNGKPKAARRWLWELLFGTVPNGLVVYGTCGAADCINPAHSACGFPADVVRNNIQAVLTVGDVQAIKRSADDGLLQVTLAGQYGVAPSVISDIVNNKRWARVKKPRKKKTP